MTFLICIKSKNKVRIFQMGKTVNHLTMVVAACKAVAERVAIEECISLHNAMKFILECIENTNDSLN